MFPPLYTYPGPPGLPGQPPGPYFDGHYARNQVTNPYLNYLFNDINNVDQTLLAWSQMPYGPYPGLYPPPAGPGVPPGQGKNNGHGENGGHTGTDTADHQSFMSRLPDFMMA